MTDKQPKKTYPINLATHNYLYLARFGSTVRNALITHPRLLVIRVDLRFPDNYDVEGNKAMKAASSVLLQECSRNSSGLPVASTFPSALMGHVGR